MEVHFPHIEDAVSNRIEIERRKTPTLRRMVSYFVLTSVLISFIIVSQQ